MVPYCVMPALSHSGKGTATGTVNRSGVARVSLAGGMNGWSTGALYGRGALLHETVRVDTCHHRFVKTR